MLIDQTAAHLALSLLQRHPDVVADTMLLGHARTHLVFADQCGEPLDSWMPKQIRCTLPAVGLQPANDLDSVRLREIDGQTWASSLASGIVCGLAYGPFPSPAAPTDPDEVRRLHLFTPFLTDIVSLFRAPMFHASWSEWTIAGQGQVRRYGFDPITSNTFSAAAAIVDERHIGIFIIADED